MDLCATVAGVRKLLRRTLRENIELGITLSQESCTVMADAGQMEQILMNLAVNAQDAMPSGGVLSIDLGEQELDEAYCAIHPGARPGRYVILSVSDTGVGMDEETRRNIFEPFFTTKGEAGTGLGLSTVYGIIKQHGGSIWVYSEPGKGTAFKIYLPFAAMEAGSAKPAPKAKGDLRGSEVILVAEDNEMVRSLACSILQRQGYTVLSAKSGLEGLQLLKTHDGPVHLILSDVVMPDMNGKEFCQKAREAHPHLEALFMSGYTSDTIAHHGVLDPGVNFIQKPFTVQALTGKVRELLDRIQKG